MYITKLTLEHVRCYEGVEINLEKEDGHYSLMLAGNNGSGKSAILRSIAMGLCDQISAGSLLRELQGDFVRKQKGEKERTASITIDLKDNNDKRFKIRTEITTNSSLGFEWVEQYLSSSGSDEKVELEDFPWNKIFVTAYGAGLRTEGTEDYGQYFAADAVYSLFKYSHPMQNPELIWRRLIEVAESSVHDNKEIPAAKTKVIEKIQEVLLTILNLSSKSDDSINNNVFLENNGIYIESEWGKQELSALGDGYRGLTTMIMDILSWQLLMKNNKIILKELENNKPGVWLPLDIKKDCKGIVIIDEIEKHLHPKLQRLVVEKLKEVFPKIQFIISSHSPLCVAGTADAEEHYKVYRTLSENGKNRVKEWVDGLSGLRTDQILEHFFQVPYINEATLSDLENYSRLYLRNESEKELVGEEKNDFNALKKKLSKTALALLLERESKLLNEAIDSESEIIRKMIEKNND